MKIVTIDWERKIIEEIETDSVKYEDDGVPYTCWSSKTLRTINKIPYQNFLGVKDIN